MYTIDLLLISGLFCHDLLLATIGWKPDKSLVDVVKIVVDRIDKPDLDYTSDFGQLSLHSLSSFCREFDHLDIGKEYKDNRNEFNRKASELIRQHGLPRQ